MIIVALGSNQSFCGQPPAEIIRRALESIAPLGAGFRASRLFRSPSWPDPSRPAYVNAVAILADSEYRPQLLIAALHAIEAAFGREREYHDNPALRFAPRTLDLDLIAWHDHVCGEDPDRELVLPHHAVAERDFMLCPLADVAPDWRHPLTGRSAVAMRDDLPEITAFEMEAERESSFAKTPGLS